MITVNKLTYQVGTRTLFNGISFILQPQSKIGLVGRNGEGKSTLLDLLAHPEKSHGCISKPDQIRVAYLPQEVVLHSSYTVLEETIRSVQNIGALQDKIALYEQQLAVTPDDKALVTAYGTTQSELLEIDTEKIKSDAKKILSGLGLTAVQIESPVNALSGGWKMRVLLAILLLQKADFYLFDEPTNHLDIFAKDWLLAFLKQASFGFMLVCHERYFLDAVCTSTIELERGKATIYPCNYSGYIELKEKSLEQLVQAHKQQQKVIEQKRATAERFRASASKAKAAQAMFKEIERMEKIELPPNPKTVSITLGNIPASGKTVLTVENLNYAFGAKTIFEGASFTLNRGQRVALIAPNGIGKTTLLKIIAGIYPLQKGSITFGHNVTFAYFDQDQTAALPKESTIFDAVIAQAKKSTEQEIRTILGAFLFSGDDLKKKIKVLSGGEKNRVGMVITFLQHANLLLLDEPTNHLDIPSKQILLNSLKEYNGTLLFVSHDHDFINGLATEVIELTHKATHTYPGTYDDYKNHWKEKQSNSLSQTQVDAVSAKKTVRHKTNSNSLEVRTIEKEIAKLEKKIAEITDQFNSLSYGTAEYIQADQ